MRTLTEATYHDPIVGAWSSTTLSVPEARYTGVKAKAGREHLLHIVCTDRVEVFVDRSFGNDDDRPALADCTVLSST